MLSNLTGLMSEVSNAEKKLAGLGQEYVHREQREKAKLEGLTEEYKKKRQEEEARLRSALEPLEAELERTKVGIDELMKEVHGHGLSLREALDGLRRISDLGREAGELGTRVEAMRKELDKVREEKKSEERILKDLKSQRASVRRDVSTLREALSWLFRLQLAVENEQLVLPCKICGQWAIYVKLSELRGVFDVGGSYFRCASCGQWPPYQAQEVAWYLAQLVLPSISKLNMLISEERKTRGQQESSSKYQRGQNSPAG